MLSIPHVPIIIHRRALERKGEYESYAIGDGHNAGCLNDAAHSFIWENSKVEKKECDLHERDTCGVEDFLNVEKLFDIVSRFRHSCMSKDLT